MIREILHYLRYLKIKYLIHLSNNNYISLSFKEKSVKSLMDTIKHTDYLLIKDHIRLLEENDNIDLFKFYIDEVKFIDFTQINKKEFLEYYIIHLGNINIISIIDLSSLIFHCHNLKFDDLVLYLLQMCNPELTNDGLMQNVLLVDYCIQRNYEFVEILMSIFKYDNHLLEYIILLNPDKNINELLNLTNIHKI
jgi:hypothetical protein